MATQTTDVTATLDNCDEEPIRIPGSIQRHGFLILLDERGESVAGASENISEFLGIPPELILGAKIDTFLDREILAALRGSNQQQGGTRSLVTYLGSFAIRGKFYSVATHEIHHERVVEFEKLDQLVSSELMNAVITNFVTKLSGLRSKEELCRAIAAQIKELTGFNRVLVYSFDAEGHGTVLTEENDGVLPSYLDLRFPASDIPRQARELYVLNTVRIIPDANYVPSPLRGLPNRPLGDLDLSMSLLRSVSPIHQQYMRNMGTMSSLSTSILCEGKLWGLISCHHAEPRMVPYLVRSACDLLTKMMGTQLAAFRTAERLEKTIHFQGVQRRILTQIAAEKNYVAAMVAQMEALTSIADAGGVALLLDGRCVVAGEAPDQEAVLRLAEWLDKKPDQNLFASSHLADDLAWTKEIADVASGLLAIRISDVRRSYVMWFRPEIVRTVQWAGEPMKVADEKLFLHPRKSFDLWKEKVRGQSQPWSEMEIESAMEFRGALITISLRRAEQEMELSEERFRQLTHALPTLIWTAEDTGELTYVNRQWRDKGLGSEGCWYEGGRLAPEDGARCAQRWRAAVEAGKTFEEELRFRYRTEPKERWNLVRATPFLRMDRSRAGWVGTCTDLTDRREREAALRVTEKLALTGRMTSVIAHEINNPLASITNLLYLLTGEVKENETAAGYIQSAESELQRISGITKQTLRWSRESIQKAETGRVGSLFEDVLRLFAGKIRNREVQVFQQGDLDVTFFGVIGQVHQVVANLLSNAIDAAPVGGAVKLTARAIDEATIEIEVEDNGQGLSEEARTHLFQPFFTTKGDLGNGLGLYISHEIVERHGGKILVANTNSLGTKMLLRLPRGR
jgi:PAS domain S-box-containing protein